ncbi:sugar phosphate isomerase/epimerase [Paenibacillus periandrae]|uniref:sugar phosphate isomerase/epimerase n=1 Tax=Paenibacillus periandrae TaxID=1761741 RepID=UPI001F0893B0|nr:sugar phosphate isomerase/epimerase [Paenibacillus periandrae]
MKSFPYGSVLKVQREFTLETIKKKLDDMKQCGMNFVVIWPAVFWWENKANANYPFQTGIEILKHAEQIGMKVIMELAGQITALEYASDFLMREEYYATKANGSCISFISHGHIGIIFLNQLLHFRMVVV